MMVTVEDREAETDQRRLGVALQKLAVGVADQKVDRLGEEQRTHMPEILARIDMAVFPKGERPAALDFFFPGLAAIGGKDVRRLGSQFKQEARQAKARSGSP